jgi:Arc/MetJ-type ribon-helix-helix transcriptional regulator
MKKPISATIDVELLKWIDHELQDKKKYRNKSHLIEIALEMLKNSKNKGNK